MVTGVRLTTRIYNAHFLLNRIANPCSNRAPPLILARGGRAVELKQLFGTSLRRCRRSRGLTQAQLAEATGLSLEMIGRLERGVTAPSFETIGAVSVALRVAPAVLFGARPRNIDPDRADRKSVV